MQHDRSIILQPQPAATTVVLQGELVVQVDGLMARMAEAPAITDQASLDQVRAIMVEASHLGSEVDNQRVMAKRPWLAVGATIDGAVKPVVGLLDTIKNECKAQIAAFLTEQDRLRAEAERARRVAEAAAAASLAVGDAPKLQVTLQPQEIVAPTAKRKTPKVVDEKLIPRKYWMLHWPNINADLRDGVVIPGIEVVEETSVVAR